MNFPHMATISRMTQSGTKFVYQTVGTSKCFLQPADQESSELFALTYAKGSVVYFPYSTDIKEKDRVTILGNTYGVKGIQPRDYGGLPHKKAGVELV